jgi:GDP-D-mannose dehydratase
VQVEKYEQGFDFWHWRICRAGISPDMIINLAAVSNVGASWGMPQATIMINVVGDINIM